MKSCLYTGWVRHRRSAPAVNRFRYRVFLPYLDLDELPDLFRKRWLWSYERPNVASFRRRDHFGDPRVSLADAVRDLVQQRTGARPVGPIRLLCHLRYLGYCFNPVSFYYCWDRDETRVEAVVAEITNTPWNERYCYVLSERDNEGTTAKMRFRFGKSFHVSPFIGMDVAYDWRFTAPGERLTVHMADLRDGKRFFDATMALVRRPLTGGHLAAALTRYPFMTGKVTAAIYWQALRLWLKRCPYHPHPARSAAAPRNARP